MAIAPVPGASWGNNMPLSDYSQQQLDAAREYITGFSNNPQQIFQRALELGIPAGDVAAVINNTLGGNLTGGQVGNVFNFLQGQQQPFPALPPAMQPQPLGNPFEYTPNPYLPQMEESIRTQMTDNLQRNVLPSIGTSAVAAGGYGGSRQGVLEANALKDMNQGLSNSLASLNYGDYNNAMNRQLQQYGMNQNYNLGLGNLNLGMQNSLQNYNLGLGNLALGNQNSMQNFYSTQRGQDMQQMQLGANLFQMGNQGMLGQGQFLYNLGLTQQQAPWQVMGNYTNTLSPFTGYGSTSGNPFAGAIGGALTGAQLYNIFNG